MKNLNDSETFKNWFKVSLYIDQSTNVWIGFVVC